MKLKAEAIRDGTSQRSRSLRALDPDYVSVDERTLADWIRWAQTVAKHLTYFDEHNQADGDWSAFFAGEPEAMAAAMASLETDLAASAAARQTPKSTIFAEILQRMAQPHLALFLTFLHLLRYPQTQFKALTQRRLDFYYRQILQLAEQTAIPDRAHVIFSLLPNQIEAVLAKGTRLSAGADQQGTDLHYALDTDLYLTQAQVASVKTLSVETIYINLQYIHLADHQTSEAFENMLRWAVGNPNQGDPLPIFPPSDPLAQDSTGKGRATFAAIMALFEEIQDYTLEQVTTARQQYILEQLCFVTLDEFKFCLDVHTREVGIQQGNTDIQPPTDLEWQQVYRLIEKAYRKRMNRNRRDRLKQEHHSENYQDSEAAFLGLWRYALGNPDAGDLLPPFLEQREANLADLWDALDGVNSEDAARYIQDQLWLSIADFRKIMDIQDRLSVDRDHSEWDEVYRWLERAQTRKRAFTYPDLGRTEIKAIAATAVAETEPDQPLTLPRFHPFIAQPLETDWVQALGVAIAAPVLHLQEGYREIVLTLACQANTFKRDLLQELLKKGERPFAVTISSDKGWLPLPPQQVQFDVGDFFLESRLRAYRQVDLAIIYDIPDGAFSAQENEGQYLHFPNGSLTQIDAVLSPTRVQLTTIGWVGLREAVAHYAALEWGGNGVQRNNFALSDDRKEIQAIGRPSAGAYRFKASDVDDFIVWSDGVIYQITEFAGTTRVGVRSWGYRPGTGQVWHYDRIAFSTAPTHRFSNLTVLGIALTSAADTKARFTAQDRGTLFVGVNDDLYQLEGLMSGREARVIPLGRIERKLQPDDATVPTRDRQIEQYSGSGIYPNSLQFKFVLDATQPAITAPLGGDDLMMIDTPHPMIKITLADSGKDSSGDSSYQSFKDICLEKANIQVAVQDLQGLQLRNDRTVLNPKSPFEPFDSQPMAGATLYFAHPEIVSKQLDDLSLRLEWMGLPTSLADHYYAYAHCGLSPRPPVIHNDSFKAQLDLLLNRTWYDLGARSLFNTDATESTQLSPQVTLDYDKASLSTIPAAPFAGVPAPSDSDDLWDHTRYFRLELNQPDFQHSIYPLVLNKVARAKEDDVVTNSEGERAKDQNGNDIPMQSLSVYPPYTPKLKSITLNYQASAEIHLGTAAREAAAGQLFQLHPFGYLDLQQTVNPKDPSSCYFLLPQYDHEGSLCIGLRDLQPPQQLTLLFQLVSGSGNADLTNPEIEWSYLANDRWQPFQPEDVLSDSTNGLLDSGILHVTIPAAATDRNHLLPAGLHWLRAAVSNHAMAIPDVLDIRTQVVTATFVDQNNAPEHLNRPLAANSIEALVERNPSISVVEQPYSSFGGRRRETHRMFYTRVSERLRHKNRAITRWDYERLVLEQFPQIYKVKCLTQAEQTQAPNAAQVTVVVIPNLANTAPFLPLEPKAPQYLLREIEVFLQAHTSPFVKVRVKNPRYEQIKYRVAVRFRAGYEQGYYLKQLNEELVRFLSPWAYEEQSDISFGSSIHSSAVIHFIETRPYVDYVANLKLIEQVTLATAPPSTVETNYQVNLTNLAQVQRVDSILVSAPQHIIDLITTSDYEEEVFEGIDYMIIDLDFLVT